MAEQEQDLEWLRSLDPRLWERKEETEYYNGSSGKRTKTYAKYERITDDELTRVFEIVLKLNLPICMYSTEFGFGVGLGIHEPEKPSLFPGTEEETVPDLIVVISMQHLPLSQSTFEAKDRITFDDGWRVFSELTHRDQNLDLVKRCGLPEPKGKGHYAY